MDRTHELTVIAEELLRCAASLTSAAEKITALQKNSDQKIPANPKPTITLEQVRAADQDHLPRPRIPFRRRGRDAFPVLSMGMSDTFELAIEEGANLVRVGSALFGKRETRL